MARILVVDDEKLLVKGIRFNLENEGDTVDVGYNGRQAVDLARATEYDLIILDVMMPEVDGQEACLRIREFSNGAHHHAHRQERGRGQADGL